MPKSDTQFQGQGKGISHKIVPISVKYPQDIDRILRGLPDRSEYIRAAVIAQLKRDGLLEQ